MSNISALDRALIRLAEKYPPKHPDRSKMRRYELVKANAHPIVHDANGYSPDTVVLGTVDWAKQDRIPVGKLDTGLWCDPPQRGLSGKVRSGKGRGNKGPKGSG